jgi:hypothetical protein
VVPVEEAVPSAVAEPMAAFAECRVQLVNGRVTQLVENLQDQHRLSLDAARTSTTTQRTMPDIVLLTLELSPATDQSCADTKPRSRFTMAGALRHPFESPRPKIDRQSFRHVHRPPAPADISNQIPVNLSASRILSARLSPQLD